MPHSNILELLAKYSETRIEEDNLDTYEYKEEKSPTARSFYGYEDRDTDYQSDAL